MLSFYIRILREVQGYQRNDWADKKEMAAGAGIGQLLYVLRYGEEQIDGVKTKVKGTTAIVNKVLRWRYRRYAEVRQRYRCIRLSLRSRRNRNGIECEALPVVQTFALLLLYKRGGYASDMAIGSQLARRTTSGHILEQCCSAHLQRLQSEHPS